MFEAHPAHLLLHDPADTVHKEHRRILSTQDVPNWRAVARFDSGQNEQNRTRARMRVLYLGMQLFRALFGISARLADGLPEWNGPFAWKATHGSQHELDLF